MAEQERKQCPKPDEEFCRRVGQTERRMLRAKSKGVRDVWFGLGSFGMIGWAVAVPTVLMVFIGVWIDSKTKGPRSWTLMFLLFGLIIGCANAWSWIKKQRNLIKKEREDDDAS